MTKSDATLKPLISPQGEPVLDEAWQAEVLAMADTLVASGIVSANTWSATLGNMLEIARQNGEPDTPLTYYQCALSALEQVILEHDCLTRPEITQRKQQWYDAYLRTPHGQPVELDS